MRWVWDRHFVQSSLSATYAQTGNGLDDCKTQFRAAWARIRASLTDQGIARARRYSENSAAALARYDARRHGDPKRVTRQPLRAVEAREAAALSWRTLSRSISMSLASNASAYWARPSVMSHFGHHSSSELLQYGLCFLQDRCVETLGEPAVDRRE